MSASPRPEARAALSVGVIEAGRRFFRENPARILTVASHLRAPDRTIESTVLGVSMGRTMPAGSRIRIELAPPRRYARGEVIAFVAGPHVIVHRVVRPARGWTERHLLPRGDAAWCPDPPLDAEHVLGAVVAIQRNRRWTPVDDRPPQPWPTRILTAVVLAAVACALRAGPGAAETLVTVLHRTRFLRSGGASRARLSGPP